MTSGLVKGYQEVHESAAVMRGRWDVSRQLATRPGLPLPLEIDFDDFTPDIPVNRILHTAVRALRTVELPKPTALLRDQLLVEFIDVGTVPRGGVLPDITFTRLTEHLAGAANLARMILEAVSWTHRDGARRGGTFLVNMANIFEAFVAERLRSLLITQSLNVTSQDMRWWLDEGRTVALRPDIVISRDRPVAVADTKYKVLTDAAGAPPSTDVYQMVAYALALDVSSAHLIYVSGDVVSGRIDVPVAGAAIHLHAVRLDGSIDQLEHEMEMLAAALAGARAASRATTDERASEDSEN